MFFGVREPVRKQALSVFFVTTGQQPVSTDVSVETGWLRLFLTVTWKSGLGNFSGTNISHVTFGGNLLHQDTVWDFPELFSRQLCSRKFCQISKSNSQRLEISGSPKETYHVPFLERSIFGCWFKSIFGTKRTLWEKLPSTFFRQPPATLLALLSGACSKTDFQVPISKSP